MSEELNVLATLGVGDGGGVVDLREDVWILVKCVVNHQIKETERQTESDVVKIPFY